MRRPMVELDCLGGRIWRLCWCNGWISAISGRRWGYVWFEGASNRCPSQALAALRRGLIAHTGDG